MTLITFLKNNWLPATVVALSLAALIYFASGFLLNLVYFNDPRHQNQALEAWMTPRYVVMSYDLPPRIIDEIMKLEPHIDKRKPLSDVASELNITLDELTAQVKAAAEKHHGETK